MTYFLTLRAMLRTQTGLWGARSHFVTPSQDAEEKGVQLIYFHNYDINPDHQIWPGDVGAGRGGDHEPLGGEDPGYQGPGQEKCNAI